ncbi:MAG: hypothetical protein DI607_10910 [Sphingomonas hengshuiensis]|nr:MAG: hypothetical protein DI607_10910 [Sphingomonas hengshuiensis]
MCFGSTPKIPDATVPQEAKQADSSALATAQAKARTSGSTSNRQLRTGPSGVVSTTSGSLLDTSVNSSLLGG